MRIVNVIVAAACFALGAGEAVAAEDTNSVDLDELRVPASPAFTILGVSPTAVERPTSSRAFAFSALSATERAGGSIPSNLAMEFTPYWWYDRPDLTLERFYNASFAQRVAQSFAVSIGSSELATYRNDDSLDGTALAVGARVNLFGGKPVPQLPAAIGKLQEAQTSLAAECVPDLDEGATSGSSEIDLSSPECRKLQAALDAQAKAVASLNKERVGLVVDAALAVAREYPDNITDQDRTSKYGVWLTWSYRSQAAALANPNAQSYLVFAAVQRWLRDEISDEDAVDVGARLIYKSSADKWAVSAEYLKRFGDGDLSGDSTRIEFEYVLSERYTLVAALGRDFETAQDRSPLVAIAGLNVGLGRGPSQRLQRP
jgi:hypothetical protein